MAEWNTSQSIPGDSVSYPEVRQQSRFANHFTPAEWDSPSDHFWSSESLKNTSRAVRTTLRSIVTDTMLNEDLSSVDAVATLEDCRHSCEESGVSFSEMLSEDMDHVGVTPLHWEIMRAKWNETPGSELLLFLLMNSLSVNNKVEWTIRRACIARGDNDLFQFLMQHVPKDHEDVHYTLSLVIPEVPRDQDQLHCIILIHNFQNALSSQLLQHGQGSLDVFNTEHKSPFRPFRKYVSVEWIARGRAWCLEISSNAISLILLEGDAVDVKEACLNVVQDTSTIYDSTELDDPFRDPPVPVPPSILLDLPPRRLYPLQSSGSHRTTLNPCFPIYNLPYSPHSFYECVSRSTNELLLEVTVMGKPLEKSETQKVSRIGVSSHIESTIDDERERETKEEEEGIEGKGEEKAPSELDSEDWQSVHHSGTSTPQSHTDEEWELASWSGRDEFA